MSAVPQPTLPQGWRRVEARRYPGCHYYLKPDGTATWLLEGQTRKDLPKGLHSIYGCDFSHDAALIDKVNPKIAIATTRRHSSYAEHPKVADSKDTYVSLKQKDFIPFPSKPNYKPVHKPYQPHPFGNTSLYRSSYADYTIDDEGSIHSGALSAQALREGGTLADERQAVSEALHGATPSLPRKRPDEELRIVFRPSSAPQARIASAVSSLQQMRATPQHGGYQVQRSTPIPRPPTASDIGTGYKESVHRAYRARPKDFSEGRKVPFTRTSDYRSHFVDFKPPRPHIAHPEDQVSFGDRVNEDGAAGHPNSLYRVDYQGEQPYLGKARKSVIHARMKGIPSNYVSRSSEEYVSDKHLPNPAFRERMRAIDAEVVKRLKETNSIGDGY